MVKARLVAGKSYDIDGADAESFDNFGRAISQ
jgi:hypothetical protein